MMSHKKIINVLFVSIDRLIENERKLKKKNEQLYHEVEVWIAKIKYRNKDDFLIQALIMRTISVFVLAAHSPCIDHLQRFARETQKNNWKMVMMVINNGALT